MALGLSRVNAQLTSLQDQSHASTDLLRLGGGAGSQFEHLICPSNQSPFRPPQAPPPSAFFLDNGSNQDFNGDQHQPHHSLLQSKPFHGLMQLPDLQRNANTSSTAAAVTASNLFNLSFFSNSSSASSVSNSNINGGKQNSQILIANGFNIANGSTEPTTLFSGNLMSDHVNVGGMTSLYNTSMQNESILPQMSATALLQKAAQMGATTSGGSSLLRGFGSSSSGSTKPPNLRGGCTGVSNGGYAPQAQMENEAHLQNLMNSLTNEGASLFAGAGGVAAAAFGIGSNTGGHQKEARRYGAFDGGLCNAETKFNLSSSTGSLGGSDRLTRDFLGVGSMVRGIGSGMSQREQNQGIDMSALDPEMKLQSSSPSFASGSLQ